jgi:hypothetical protein
MADAQAHSVEDERQAISSSYLRPIVVSACVGERLLFCVPSGGGASLTDGTYQYGSVTCLFASTPAKLQAVRFANNAALEVCSG